MFSNKPDLRLSAAQLKVFDGWKRAAEALPPPAWYTPQERRAGPTMSSSRTIVRWLQVFVLWLLVVREAMLRYVFLIGK
jgi:hypothetical protein